MIERRRAGVLPDKHHQALRDEQGRLRYEACTTRQGFDGPYTISYHLGRPQSYTTQTSEAAQHSPAQTPPVRRRHFQTGRVTVEAPASGCAERLDLLTGQDVRVGIVRPVEDEKAYTLGQEDELLFILKGSGTVRSQLGDLAFEANDYVLLPKGIAYRLLIDGQREQHYLSLHFRRGIGIPHRFRTSSGQLRMDAPYSHRDFRAPTFSGPLDEGIRTLMLGTAADRQRCELTGSPLDVVGWDGSVYPFAFSIYHFQPRVSSYHLPPTWHGTFSGPGALVCSFVPRPLDFGTDAVPCPYVHTSVDMDEVLFYVDGDFASRRGVAQASITHHPQGMPHGPHPGKYEQSLGKTHTQETAVMLDCEDRLRPTELALSVEDSAYDESFL